MASHLIKDIRFFEATSAVSKPIADATHEIPEIKFVITEIELASGIIGQGYMLCFHYSANAIAGALKDLKDFMSAGYQVHETVRIAKDYASESEYFGQTGLLKWAISSVNIAMWDAWGKVNNQPVWKLLGGSQKAIPVYGSGGWLSYNDDELVEEVKDYRSRGFRAVKIKVGSSDVRMDIQRLRKVREAVGTDVKIMMDANQGLDVATAVKLAAEAETIDIHWFEEPVAQTDYLGYQTLCSKTNIPIAMGERQYDCDALRALISRNALDIWQPDLVRIGGVEAWRDSAALAKAYGIPVAPHYYKDYDVPLLCTITNEIGAEYFDWIDELIDNPMQIHGGLARPREGAGWGFSFRYDKMKDLFS